MNPSGPNLYDPANILELVGYAADCYKRGHSVPGQFDVFTAPGTDGKAVIYYTPTDVIICFQGTTNLEGWLHDGNVRKILENGCEMHEGFSQVTTSLEGFISPELEGWKDKRVWVTGHSLGGAVAVYYAWRVVVGYGHNPFSGIVTFGQPRVGNEAFRDSWTALGLNEITWRVVHAQDLVPRVPWLLGAYRHVEHHEVFFPGFAPCLPAIDPGLISLIRDDVRGIADELWHDKFGLLADHHIQNYVDLFN